MVTNWKTTLLGVVGLALVLASIWLPKYSQQLQATAAAVAASGLFVAKDHDK